MLRILKRYYPARNAIFVLGESIMIYAGVLLASALLLGIDWLSPEKIISRKAIFITVVFQGSLYWNDLYDSKVIGKFGELGTRLLQALGLASLFMAVVYFLFPDVILAKGVFVTSAFFVMLLIVIWRFAYNEVLNRGWFNQKIIIMGSGTMAKSIVEEIQKRRDCGYSIALVIRDSKDQDAFFESRTALIDYDKCEDLCALARDLGAKKIIVALSDRRGFFPFSELLNCRAEGTPVLEGQSFYEMLAGKLIVNQLNPGWIIFEEGFKKSRSRLTFKRLRDIIFSAGLLILFTPLILLTMLLIKIDTRGPIFCFKNRVGENGKMYKIYNFRTNHNPSQEKNECIREKINNHPPTLVGRLIRFFHIDALPQFWNVIKGDMSLVGPRPETELVVKQLEKSIPYYNARFTIKPGVTGWGQVNCLHGASVEDALEMLNYDLFYIKNVSFLMDMVIVMRSTKLIFMQRRDPSLLSEA